MNIKLKKLHKELCAELLRLVAAQPGGSLKFGGVMITVVDPDADPEFGSGEVNIEALRYDERIEEVYAEGAPYDEDGIRLDDYDPIMVGILTADEVAALLEQAKKDAA